MSTSTVLYAIYTAVNLAIILWGISIWRRRPTRSVAILIAITFGLAYDNFILTLGTWLSSGRLLLTLSWPRFILHQLVLPWMILAVYELAADSGLPWAASRRGRVTAVLLSILVMIGGIFTRLVPVVLVAEEMDGIVRYIANNVVGPPIVSILSIGLAGIMGISWWRRLQWPWLTLIVIAVFIAEGFPNEAVRRVFGSGLEIILMGILFLMTLRFRPTALAAANHPNL